MPGCAGYAKGSKQPDQMSHAHERDLMRNGQHVSVSASDRTSGSLAPASFMLRRKN
eukprot:SAG31_NODE_11423_length_1032_cov_1.372990_1_plen_55_part_10